MLISVMQRMMHQEEVRRSGPHNQKIKRILWNCFCWFYSCRHGCCCSFLGDILHASHSIHVDTYWALEMPRSSGSIAPSKQRLRKVPLPWQREYWNYVHNTIPENCVGQMCYRSVGGNEIIYMQWEKWEKLHQHGYDKTEICYTIF